MVLKSLRLICIESTILTGMCSVHHIPTKDNNFVNACLLAFYIPSNLPKHMQIASLCRTWQRRRESEICFTPTVEKSVLGQLSRLGRLDLDPPL